MTPVKIISMQLQNNPTNIHGSSVVASFSAEFSGMRFTNCAIVKVEGYPTVCLPQIRTRAGVPAGIKIIDRDLLDEFRTKAQGAYRALSGETETIAAG